MKNRIKTHSTQNKGYWAPFNLDIWVEVACFVMFNLRHENICEWYKNIINSDR